MWCLDDRRKKVWVEQSIDVDTNKTLRRAMLRRQRVLYYAGFLVLLMIATICFLPVVMLLARLLPTSQLAVTLLSVLVCSILLAVMLLYWNWWLFIRYGGGRLRKAGLCLCCLYEMTKCPAEEDGCTICPECGAAWKVGEGGGRRKGQAAAPEGHDPLMESTPLYDNVDARGREVRLRTPAWRVAVLAVIAAAVVVGSVVVIIGIAPGGAAAGICGIPALFGALLILANVEKHGMTEADIRRRLAAGCCPACRYPIDDLRPEEDGCTICPECGAAWKVQGAAREASGGEAGCE